ncbi:glycosyltransferase, partial [candidate division WWE3 bacterium]|nr:glycosyltransferase [candidate division WWE3 bacterium]
MRIAISADSFPPLITGATTHTVELVRWLLHYGHEVLVFAPRFKNFTAKDLPADLQAAKVIYMRSIPTHYHNARLSVPNSPKIFYYLQKFKPDVVDLQAPSFQGIDVMTVSKALQIPIAATFHTLFTSREYLEMIFRIKRVQLLEKSSWSYHRWFYNSADSVLLSTQKLKELLIENGISQNKIEQIPILFNFDSATILSTEEITQKRNELGLKENVALFVGRISKEKALDVLLEAWKIVIAKSPESSLVIVGDGPYEQKFKHNAEEAGIIDSIVFLGRIENKELLSSGIMSVADVFVSASTSETFGLTGLEAMAHTLPVILADAQGLSEMITPDIGFVCQPKNP